MVDEKEWFELLKNQLNEQIKTNVQILERLDGSNEKLNTINGQFVKVLERYDNVSTRMTEITNKMETIGTGVSTKVDNFKTHLYYICMIGVAIGVAIAGALIKMAFF